MLRTSILAYLTAVATTRWEIALAWHVALGGLLGAGVAGWHPSQRQLGTGMALLPASVALVAGGAGNPFNAAVFTILALLLLALGLELPARRPSHVPALVHAAAAALIAFGWIYPHFLSGPWIQYLYASPLGLIPCPTLAVLAGLTLLGGIASARAGRLVGAAAVAYGALGVLYLRVAIDVVLLVGGLAILLSRRSALRPADARTAGTASAPRTC